jgi:hypothetical protein
MHNKCALRFAFLQTHGAMSSPAIIHSYSTTRSDHRGAPFLTGRSIRSVVDAFRHRDEAGGGLTAFWSSASRELCVG